MEANELSGPCAMWAFGKLLGNGAFPGEYCAMTGKPGGRGGLGSPIFPSGCEGKLGVALESLQGLRDLT